VNEVKPVRGPSRRDIGHGALAERALEPVIPVEDKFPYTIRIVSDIMESNGSSSMATVCGATLCLMDAGVPIANPVAGIAMGLIKEGDKCVVLTDIQGGEDHHGDMDFKVAGTQKGITALQMDVKVAGVGFDVLRQGLEQARDGRIEILRAMLRCIERPRTNLSEHAPRLERLVINTDKIGALIGPGGRVIRGIQEQTGATIEVDDDGVVTISALNEKAVVAARQQVEMLTQGVQVGKVYEGKVVGIKEFGAFVELFPGQDGLLHISELADKFVKTVTDVVKVGDVMKVKVISVDDQGRVKLTRKGLGEKPAEPTTPTTPTPQA
jgi:polyribonucleotide nucleotidyltransferase